MDIPCRGNLLTAFFNGPRACAAIMLYSKYDDAEAHLAELDAQQLMQKYAHFLIIKVIELWLVEAANSRDLQQLLQQPGRDMWQYLRSHVDSIVKSVPSNWHVNADDVVNKIATQKLSSRICVMLETVQPWEIVYRSFQEQFNTQDTYHTTMTEKMARSHLIGKWIKAQRHAMKALSGLAVVALDQDLQKQVQDRLIAMVEYEEDTKYWGPFKTTTVTLKHPTKLGDFSAWNAWPELSQVDSKLTILSPIQCYAAYRTAISKLQGLLEPPLTVGSQTNNKGQGNTLVKAAGVTVLSLCNPTFAVGYLVVESVIHHYLK